MSPTGEVDEHNQSSGAIDVTIAFVDQLPPRHGLKITVASRAMFPSPTATSSASLGKLSRSNLLLHHKEWLNPSHALGDSCVKPRILDKIDLKILDLMQKDAKKSAAQIGEAVNLSQNACWRRINQLEEEGYIGATVALLSAEKLGAGLTV